MDFVGEVIIGNKIYSARYGEPPRAVQVAQDASQTHRTRMPMFNDSRPTTAFVTDLDEWPSNPEHDYINLRKSTRSSGGKVFTNVYGYEENIYEEINELRKSLRAVPARNPAVIDEVTRVHIGHNSVLSQLNLDLEDFLEPELSEISPPDPSTPTLHQQPDPKRLDLNESQTNEPRPRPKHLKVLNGRSKSSVSFTMPQVVAERSITRSGSVDFTESHPVRTPVHRQSSFASSAPSQRHGLHGFANWTEKCSHLLGKSKKVFKKDRKSESADSAGSGTPETSAVGCVPPGSVTCAHQNDACALGDAATTINASTPVAPCSTPNVDKGVETDKIIYEDIDEECLDAPEWSSTRKREKTADLTRARQSCSTVSDESEQWNDFESPSTEEEDIVDVEGTDFDIASEDSSKSNEAQAKGLRALLTGKSLRNKLRPNVMKTNSAEPARVTSPPPVDRRFSRFFSLRRSSDGQMSPSVGDSPQWSLGSPTPDANRSTVSLASTISNCSSTLKNMLGTRPSPMPLLAEEEEIIAGLGLGPGKASLSSLFQRRYQPPMLPPAPSNLSPEQIKRRCIVATIIHSENSYVASLQRLVNDYKRPLEESNPPIISSAKISVLFHRISEILQCHTIFRMALSECARAWDKDEKIGDVFMANFSKAVVLDIYSEFINSFSQAIDLAKQESKRKSAFADFLKVKQYQSHDRLSFFGLMVKPVQRFPQFILLLQDLLKHTPYGHPDRMSLQLALTQLESLAELLNERKREAEQYQAFRDMLKRVSGKLSLRPLADKNRYLLRQDDVHLMEFTQSGMISKTKDRRLLLLNDLLVCVAVNSKTGQEFRTSSERLALKWALPVVEIEVNDTNTSPTMSRFLSNGLRSKEEPLSGVDNLCQEMNKLMHDYDVISRTISLVETLHKQYEGLEVESMRNALSRIQQLLQQKDEEMSWIDSCCLELSARNRSGREEKYTFQMESPDVRKNWIIELRLAQLALDPRNSPSWDVPEQERRPSTKMPLYVKSYNVFKSEHMTEARCGCFYTINFQRGDGSMHCLGPRLHNVCWIVTSDGISSHVTLLTSQQPVGPSLKETSSFSLVETKITCVEFSPGCGKDALSGDLVWMGTENRRIVVYSAVPSDQYHPLASLSLPAAVVQLKYHHDQMFVGLANGMIGIFKRNEKACWDLDAPSVLVALGRDPIVALLPIGPVLYVACGSDVFVLAGSSGETQRHFSIRDDHRGEISAIAHSGIGLWISLRNSSTICLYHAETFRHLQDINVASNVNRLARLQTAICVTALKASKGLLWVGTNVGIVLSIPLPRLEGVPIISGRANVSYHAHSGPVNFFLGLHMSHEQPVMRNVTSEKLKNRTKPSASLQFNTLPRVSKSPSEGKDYMKAALTLPRSRRKVADSDIFGLYEQLMTVKDCNDSSVERANELCRSDPDLAAIPAKVSTLDRRLRMKMTRPRSLDMSNWSVESRSSLHTTSSGSDDGAPSQNAANLKSSPVIESPLKSPESRCSDTCRTIFTMSGGRGYSYFDTSLSETLPSKSQDAYIMLWEMKL